MQPIASIIIVNWNGLQHLPECLDSLAAQTFRNFEVVLVDNGSADGSVFFLREHYPWVNLVALQENTGFATGNNRGFAAATGRFIVTLNNDTRVEPDWLEILIRVAEEHPEVGMVGCRICSFRDPDVIDSLGMGICRDGMSRGRYRNLRWSAQRLGDVEEILFPSACAALYKRAMVGEIGFFDDDFFAYAEDSDLGLRGRLAGWGALLATNAVVYHKYSQSSSSLSSFKVFLVERNHYWAVIKNFPTLSLMALPWFTLLRFIEQGRVVLKGVGTGEEFRSGSSGAELIWASLKGVASGLVGMGRMLQKRRLVMQSKRISQREFSRLLSRYRIGFRELFDAQ